MRIGVLGTGAVGQTVASRLAELGHDVVMGAREAGNERATAWAAGHRGRAGTFATAAGHGELVVNATAGVASLVALEAAGRDRLAGKVLLDLANPLDPSRGSPPCLAVVNTDSLGELIQRTFPEARVVKALNMVNCEVMVHPDLVPGGHTTFVAGEDGPAKGLVVALLRELGWHDIVDLGGIASARGMEMYVMFWLQARAALGTSAFNIQLRRAG
ncbi:MAG TPA: NAD(P)-binding domain-containing protein [Micromonosporaceae bacterium]|nr:NAD(P)-binding domain-containing protein [Micromonosporaceae bacterium]